MVILDKQVKFIIESLMEFAVPKGMEPKERAGVAKKAGLSPETLRTMSGRKSVNADTLVRLLIARGVNPKLLLNLPYLETPQVDGSELEWIKFGQKMKSQEKVEFVRLAKFLRVRWGLIKKKSIAYKK